MMSVRPRDSIKALHQAGPAEGPAIGAVKAVRASEGFPGRNTALRPWEQPRTQTGDREHPGSRRPDDPAPERLVMMYRSNRPTGQSAPDSGLSEMDRTIRRILAERAAHADPARPMDTLITYTDLCNQADPDHRYFKWPRHSPIGQALFRIAEAELAAGRPPIASLVRLAGQQVKPGDGFFVGMRQLGTDIPEDSKMTFWRMQVAATVTWWSGRNAAAELDEPVTPPRHLDPAFQGQTHAEAVAGGLLDADDGEDDGSAAARRAAIAGRVDAAEVDDVAEAVIAATARYGPRAVLDHLAIMEAFHARSDIEPTWETPTWEALSRLMAAQGPRFIKEVTGFMASQQLATTG
jgi:hypothetical protein